jgi:hypothetical protein
LGQPASWEERFEELVKFKEENGTCQVHKSVPVLGQWVKQQRKEYRYYVQGTKLSSIGFDFGEQRWNTGKMKQAHAAIEKGKAQEASQLLLLASSSSLSPMPTGDRFQLHNQHHHHHHHHDNHHHHNLPLLTIPGVVDHEDCASLDGDVNDPSVQHQLQPMLTGDHHHHLQQQQQQQNTGIRYFQPAPWEQQQQQY